MKRLLEGIMVALFAVLVWNLAWAQESSGSASAGNPIQDPVALAIGALVVWGSTWLAKKILKDAIEGVWVPRIALAVSLAFNAVYVGIKSGLDWKALGAGAVVAVVQSLIATGGHELIAPMVEKK